MFLLFVLVANKGLMSSQLKKNPDYSCHHGEMECNRPKNRYKDIMPYVSVNSVTSSLQLLTVYCRGMDWVYNCVAGLKKSPIGYPWTSRFSYWANNFQSFLSNEQGLSSERSKKWPLASKVQQLLPQRTSWNSGFFFEPCNQAVSFINLACFKFLFTFKVTCTPYCEISLNHVLHVFSHSSSSSSLYLQSVSGFSIWLV